MAVAVQSVIRVNGDDENDGGDDNDEGDDGLGNNGSVGAGDNYSD